MKKGLMVLERVSAVFLPVVAVAANGITSFAAETGTGGGLVVTIGLKVFTKITNKA